MKRRLRRLIHGQVCACCGRTRRLRWYSDTRCCTWSCLQIACAFAGIQTFDEWKAERS